MDGYDSTEYTIATTVRNHMKGYYGRWGHKGHDGTDGYEGNIGTQ